MYDAIIVGAGPAGATLARLLAYKGFKTLLIEKEKLPRFKLCAGAVSLRADKYLPKDWDNAVLNTIYGGNLGWRGKSYVNARYKEPVVKIVDRSSFDAYLTLKAKDEGAKVSEGETFLNFRNLHGDYIEVITDKGVYKTRYLVGADGALSRTLRVYGIERKPVAVLEAFVETRIGNMDEVFIDIGLVKWGYGWVFPKGENTVSVGIASLKWENKSLREILKSYFEENELLRGKEPKVVRGWFIPVSKGDLELGEGNLFFVGDASGSTDALLGEGIYYAVRQAHILANCLNSKNPRNCYKKRVRELKKEFLFSYLTAFVAYNFQSLMFKNVESGDLKTFFELLRGKISYQNVFLYGLKRFFQSLIILGKSAT